jgi:hypothetical protein
MNNLSTSSSKIRFTLKFLLFGFLGFLIIALSFQFFNPVKTRSGDGYNNLTRIYQNDFIPELPKTLTVHYNNIGFLGENWSDTITRDKILFIGSSNTQSLYIPQGSTWIATVCAGSHFWFNNCGIDGSGSYEWIDCINKLSWLKPKYIVVLINPFNDKTLAPKTGKSSRLINKLKQLALFRSVIIPFYLSKLNNSQEIGHRKVDWNNMPLTNKGEFAENTKNIFIKSGYQLMALKNAIVKTGAIPVFISQPTPFGNYTNINGIDISRIKKSMTTDEFFKEFRNVLADFCRNNKVLFIDGYPLKGTENFYDITHFNMRGSDQFGRLVQEKFKAITDSSNAKPGEKE